MALVGRDSFHNRQQWMVGSLLSSSSQTGPAFSFWGKEPPCQYVPINRIKWKVSAHSMLYYFALSISIESRIVAAAIQTDPGHVARCHLTDPGLQRHKSELGSCGGGPDLSPSQCLEWLSSSRVQPPVELLWMTNQPHRRCLAITGCDYVDCRTIILAWLTFGQGTTQALKRAGKNGWEMAKPKLALFVDEENVSVAKTNDFVSQAY